MLLFSCRKASRLISDSMDRELSLRERFQMQFHKAICAMCRKFARQVAFLQNLGGEERDMLDEALRQEHLSDETRERIRRRLAGE